MGDLVYITTDQTKSRRHDRYIVVSEDGDWCNIRKFSGSQLRCMSYRVRMSECYAVPTSTLPTSTEHMSTQPEEDPDDHPQESPDHLLDTHLHSTSEPTHVPHYYQRQPVPYPAPPLPPPIPPILAEPSQEVSTAGGDVPSESNQAACLTSPSRLGPDASTDALTQPLRRSTRERRPNVRLHGYITDFEE